jgi:hypothetical protein
MMIGAPCRTFPLALSSSSSSRRCDPHMPSYGVHKNKYYVPEDVPQWAKLNLKQASKKIAKTRAKETKQALGKKAKVALKLANRKGGRGARNPASKEFAKNLAKAKALKKTKRSGRQTKKGGT